MEPSVRDMLAVVICFVLSLTCTLADKVGIGAIGCVVALILLIKWMDQYEID
jgi:hypothetical protein